MGQSFLTLKDPHRRLFRSNRTISPMNRQLWGSRMLWSVIKHVWKMKGRAFITVSSFWNDHLLALWTVKLPGFVSWRVSNEDALLHVWSKTPKRSLVLLNQDVSSTAPNTQHGDVWFAAIECFIWRTVRHRGCESSVVDMDKGVKNAQYKGPLSHRGPGGLQWSN